MKSILYAVGIGPGDRNFMTADAIAVLETVDVIVGYTTYIELIQEIFPHQRTIATPMRKEIDRCKLAVREAMDGKTVAVISSGDSGIYGMAGVLMEVARSMQANLEIEVIPGVTAASAAAAVLGAPLMHDFAAVSLSDWMTPLELIYRRISSAASADFVICLYNPKSIHRPDYLTKAADLILEYRSCTTPVGIVRDAGRKQQMQWMTTLSRLSQEPVDMRCIVIIGNSQTYVKNGRMITPRGYTIERTSL